MAENHVQAAFLLLDGGEDAVQVREVGAVALQGGDVFRPDLLDRCIQVRLAATRDEDVSALGHEPLGRSQADAAVAAGNEGNFPSELAAAGGSERRRGQSVP